MVETHFIISKERMQMETGADKFSSESQRVFVTRHHKRVVDFYDLRNLKNTKDVVVWLEDNNKLKNLKLPENVLKAISEYVVLQSKEENKNIDCFAFSCLVNGLSIPERDKSASEGYRRIEKEFDRWEEEESKWLSAGDTFFLYGPVSDSDKENYVFKHSVTYIGDGLYVSVYGLEGELTFSTMEDMQRDYNAPVTIKVRPKQ